MQARFHADQRHAFEDIRWTQPVVIGSFHDIKRRQLFLLRGECGVGSDEMTLKGVSKLLFELQCDQTTSSGTVLLS